MKQLFVFLGCVLVAGVLIPSSRVITTHFPADWSVFVMAILGGLVLYGFLRVMHASEKKGRDEGAKKQSLELLDPSTDAYYSAAMDELEGDDLHKATWAKALSESRGGVKAAEALYIKLRARHLAKEREVRLFRRSLTVSALLVVLVIFLVWTALA